MRFAIALLCLPLAAQDAGRFTDEIVPMCVTTVEPDGDVLKTTSSVFSVDEGPRRGTSMEGLAKLKPAFAADGTITVVIISAAAPSLR